MVPTPTSTRHRGYGQFCPVARASELVAVRWMPLVLRELLAGSRRFADLRRGIPLISPVMLSQRLRELVDAGVVERAGAGGHAEYRLTPSGQALRPVIVALGAWGQRFARDPREGDLDPGLLMWAARRRLHPEALPGGRAVLCFEFPDAPIAERRFWLVAGGGEVDLCVKPPGHAVDLTLTLALPTMASLFLGRLDPAAAVRSGAVALRGQRGLSRSVGAWFPRSPFAGPAGHAGPQAPAAAPRERRREAYPASPITW